MKNTLLLLSLSILLTACLGEKEGASNAFEFEWALADFNKIESKVLKITMDENPYLGINVDRRQIRDLRKRISHEIERFMMESCRNRTQNYAQRHNKSPAETEQMVQRLSRMDRQRCELDAKTNPTVTSLEKELSILKESEQMQREHMQDVKAFAEDYTTTLIKDYSDGKFDVVIQKGRGHIVYNKTGVAIDITNAVIESIEIEDLIINNEDDIEKDN